MAKVTDIKKTEKVEKHTRHNYCQISATADGYNKAGKDGNVDSTKIYTSVFCSICGEVKEVVVASNLPVAVAEKDEDAAEQLTKAV